MTTREKAEAMNFRTTSAFIKVHFCLTPLLVLLHRCYMLLLAFFELVRLQTVFVS